MPPKFITAQQLAKAPPRFISDVTVEKHAEPTPKNELLIPYTALESAARGAVQGASFGLADEGVGFLKAVGKRVLSSDEDSAGGFYEDYRKERSTERVKNQQAEADNPGSYILGNIGGGVATSFIPGAGFLNAGKGASLLKQAGAAAKGGALYAAGASNADLTKGEVGEFASDVGTGAALGAGLQAGFAGLGKVGSSIKRGFEKLPEERAVKAVTGQNISALRKATGTTLKSPGDIARAEKAINRMGRDILDEPGVLGALDKVEDIAPKLAASREKYGKAIGEVGKQIDNLVPDAVSAKNIADKINAFADDIPQTVAGKKLQARLQEEALNFENIGKFSFADAQKFKNQFAHKAVDADALISNQDATNKIKNIISKEMEETAAEITKKADGPLAQLLGQYKELKGKYRSFKGASDAATDRAQKNLTNRFVSGSDYGAGGILGTIAGMSYGLSPQTAAIGIAGAAANKFGRERGSALAARSADALLKALKSDGVQGFLKAAKPVLDGVRKGNPAAMATFQLLRQSDPRAAEILNENSAMQRKAGDGSKKGLDLGAAGLGVVQGASLGGADEGEGFLGAVGSRVMGLDNGTARGFTESYQQKRDAARAKYQAAEQRSPKSFMLGNLAGGVGTLAVPGLNGAKFSQIAGMAGADALGRSEADLTKGEFGRAALDVASGGASGVGLALIPKVGKSIKLGRLIPHSEEQANILTRTANVFEPLTKRPEISEPIRWWSAKGHLHIRELQRGKPGLTVAIEKKAKENLEKINKHWNELPDYDGPLIRDLLVEHEALQKSFKVGKTFKLDAHSSFTANRSFIENGLNDPDNPRRLVRLMIDKSKGGKSIWGLTVYSEEMEVLLPKGKRFKIVKIEDDPTLDILQVHLEEFN